MKDTFISEVVRQIQKDNDHFSRTCILLPTKRACLYLRDRLIDEMKDETVWLPTIMSIQEFLHQYSPTTIVQDEDLLAILHGIHTSVTHQNQDFGTFYRWGQMILKDFNEIDQYLIDPDYLFHYVREFKEIEADPVLSEEQSKLLKQFWDCLPTDATSEVRRNFMETWESLGQIYDRFNNALDEEGIAYDGKAYRELLQQLEGREIRFNWQNFIMVGFNALSTFEERLFLHLSTEYNTQIYWDFNEDWMADKHAETGMFIRRYASLFPEKVNHFISAESNEGKLRVKNVEIAEVVMDTLQMDLATDLVRQWGTEDTAIILCDESLLYPMIIGGHSEPGSNFTMGFPAAAGSTTHFIKDVLDFKSYWLGPEKRISPSILLKVIRFAGIRNYLPANALNELEARIRRWGFIDKKNIDELFGADNPLFSQLLSREEALQSLISSVELLPADPGGMISAAVVKENVLHCLVEFADWIAEHDMKMTPREIWPVLRQRLAGLKIPFVAGSHDGLQVMGFLETRNLDFKNIIILSADDKNLPGSNKHSSFIPFSIKRALGLPTYRENEAIYSYHFFRLLQRAENIGLAYAPTANGMKQSRSRFIEQILYEWKDNDQIVINERTIQVPVPQADIPELAVIEKSEPLVQSGLEKYITGQKQFSASSLTTYIKCPFQFYLRYIAELKEPEDFSEDYDQRDLGRVFHKAMELFYRPFFDNGDLIDEKKLEALLKSSNFKDLITEAFVHEKYMSEENRNQKLRGQNLLVSDVILELMRMIIKTDIKNAANAPFRIIGLEKSFEDIPLRINGDPGVEIKLRGILDRVDEVHDLQQGKHIRIVDYKTGGVEIPAYKTKEDEDYFRVFFENSKYKECFQGYLYAWMYNLHNSNLPIKPAFYSAKAISKGLIFPRGENAVEQNHFVIFEAYLKELICDILDEGFPFKQSEDRDAYKYSAYDVLVD